MKRLTGYWILVGLLGGCTQEIPDPPVVAFDYAHEGAGVVAFSNQSSNATHFTWYFGDGEQAVTEGSTAAKHTYQQSGSYTVRLVARGDGGSVGLSREISINVNSQAVAPVAVITYSPNTNLTAPVSVNFSARSSTGSHNWYEWKVNNVQIATTVETSHTFSAKGSYEVSLTVQGEGGSNTTKQTITVGEASGPKADFEVPVVSKTAPVSVTFVNKSENGTAFLWNFGDGTYATGDAPPHEYKWPGVYQVILTVTGAGGMKVQKTGEIVIRPTCVLKDSKDGNTIAFSLSVFNYTDNGQLKDVDQKIYYDNGQRQGEHGTSSIEFVSNAPRTLTEKMTNEGQTINDGKTTYYYNDLGLLDRMEKRYNNRDYHAGDRGNFLYQYDDNQIVSKVEADSTTYTYANGVLTAIAHRANSTASRERIDRNLYVVSGYQITNGRISRVNYQGGAFRELTYDGKGQMRTNVFTNPADGKKITEEWWYDDKINPHFNRSRYKGHPFYIEYGYGVMENNVIRFSRKVINTAATFGEETVLTGQYDTNNLPAALTKNGDPFNQTAAYTYTCK